MKFFFDNYIKYNLIFYILTFISISLVIASFIVPPTGIIDPSVIAAVGELAGFGALGAIYFAIDKGGNTTFRHKYMEIEYNDKKLNENDENANQRENEDI